jgi:hypothetical protein
VPELKLFSKSPRTSNQYKPDTHSHSYDSHVYREDRTSGTSHGRYKLTDILKSREKINVQSYDRDAQAKREYRSTTVMPDRLLPHTIDDVSLYAPIPRVAPVPIPMVSMSPLPLPLLRP